MRQSLVLAASLLLLVVPLLASAADSPDTDSTRIANPPARPESGATGRGIKADAKVAKQGIKNTGREIKHGVKRGAKKTKREIVGGVKEQTR